MRWSRTDGVTHHCAGLCVNKSPHISAIHPSVRRLRFASEKARKGQLIRFLRLRRTHATSFPSPKWPQLTQCRRQIRLKQMHGATFDITHGTIHQRRHILFLHYFFLGQMELLVVNNTVLSTACTHTSRRTVCRLSARSAHRQQQIGRGRAVLAYGFVNAALADQRVQIPVVCCFQHEAPPAAATGRASYDCPVVPVVGGLVGLLVLPCAHGFVSALCCSPRTYE